MCEDLGTRCGQEYSRGEGGQAGSGRRRGPETWEWGLNEEGERGTGDPSGG